MSNQPFQPSRHPWLTLLFCVSIAAALNVPMAFAFIRPELAGHPTTGKNSRLKGPDASKAGWPDTTPVPWPSPDTSDTHKSFGVTLLSVFAEGQTPGKNGFQMMTEFYGWPFPVLRRTQRWWNWDDPKLIPAGAKTNELCVTGMALHWTGLILNPLILALPAWAAIVCPALVRRRSRRKRRLCEECGYPNGDSGLCSECGSPVPT